MSNIYIYCIFTHCIIFIFCCNHNPVVFHCTTRNEKIFPPGFRNIHTVTGKESFLKIKKITKINLLGYNSKEWRQLCDQGSNPENLANKYKTIFN